MQHYCCLEQRGLVVQFTSKPSTPCNITKLPRNPYQTLLNELFRTRILPHRNLANLKQNTYTRRDVLISYAILVLELVTFARFAALVIEPSWQVYFYTVGYYYGMNNNRAWYLATMILFFHALLQHLLLLRVATRTPPFYGFHLLMALQSNPQTVPLLTSLGAILWPLYMLARNLSVLFFLVVTTYNALTIYWLHINFFFTLRLILFSTLLAINAYNLITITIVWYMIITDVVTLFSFHYAQLRKNLLAEIYRISRYRLKYNRVHDQATRRILCHLNRAHRSTDLYANQTSHLMSLFYFLVLMGSEGLLFVTLDWRTHPFLRLVAIITFILCLSIFLAMFSVLCTVNLAARRLLGPLRRAVYHLRLTPSTQLKVITFQAQLEQNRVGIACGRMFVFTPSKVFAVVIRFVLNFFLVVNLFRTYFLWSL